MASSASFPKGEGKKISSSAEEDFESLKKQYYETREKLERFSRQLREMEDQEEMILKQIHKIASLCVECEYRNIIAVAVPGSHYECQDCIDKENEYIATL